MSERLIIEGNTVYEIDEDCEIKKEQRENQEKEANKRKGNTNKENYCRKYK